MRLRRLDGLDDLFQDLVFFFLFLPPLEESELELLDELGSLSEEEEEREEALEEWRCLLSFPFLSFFLFSVRFFFRSEPSLLLLESELSEDSDSEPASHLFLEEE